MAIPKRLKKWFWRFFALGIFCFVAGIFVHSLFVQQTTLSVEHHIAKMKAAGKPMQMEDFPQQEIAPEDDAGLLLAEFSKMTLPNDPPFYPEGDSIGDNGLLILARDSPSSLTQTQRDIFIHFYNKNPHIYEMWRKIGACEGTKTPDLHTLRTTYPWNWLWLQHYGLLALGTANVLSAEGRMDEATTLWLWMAKSARVVRDHPIDYISFAIASIFLDNTFGSLEDSFQMSQADPEYCRQLIDALDTRGARKGMIHALEIERVYQLDMCLRFIRGEKVDSGTNNYFVNTIYRDDSVWRKYIGNTVLQLGRPMLQKEMVELQKIAIEWENIFESEPWGWDRLIEEKRFVQTNNLPPWKILSEITGTFNGMGFPKNMGERTRNAEAMSEVLRLALAARIWQAENGAWPERLEQLAPGILESVPVDPFTGKPFRYQVSKKGFLIESEGIVGNWPGGPHEQIRWVEVPPHY